MILTEKELDNIQILNGEVLIEIESLAVNKIVYGTLSLELAFGSNEAKSKQATRFGKIAKLPVKAPVIGTDMYKCEFEGRVGDECWLDPYFVQQQITILEQTSNDDREVKVGDRLFIRVHSRFILALKRDGKPQATTGNVIGRLIAEETVTKSGIILIREQKKYVRVKVESVSEKQSTWKNPDLFRTTKVSEGDVVIVEGQYPVKLDSTYAGETDLVKFQNAMILAIEDGEN